MQNIQCANRLYLYHKRAAVLLSRWLSLALLLLWSTPLVVAQSLPLGTALNSLGVLVVVRPDNIEDRLQGQGALQLFEGDILRTEDASQALIEIKDGIDVALNANTTLKLFYRWEKARGITRILRLQQGEIWVKTGTGPKPLEVETPVATAAVRETEFNIKVQEDGQTTLTVIQGIVEFGTAFGTCPIRSSTISHGVRGKRCTKPEPVDVKPTIAWIRALGK
jgi:ferric-dicitrate binding protein FerR (iron transport regulator)